MSTIVPSLNLNTFEVDANESVTPEKIYNFFKSSNKALTVGSIQLREFSLKEKVDNRVIYFASYIFSTESLSALESIKVDDLYEGLDFKITKLEERQMYTSMVEEYIKKEKDEHVITYNMDYDNFLIKNFIKTYNTPGLEYIDQESIKKQRSVLSYMLKKIGANVFSGRGIMNVSLPIYIFDQRSVLESFAYPYKLSCHFERKITQASNLERLKMTTVFVLGTLSLSMNSGKPFNPILGETFQAKFGNTDAYFEQTSHHPPIFNFYVKNPEFISYGFSQIDIYSGPNSIKADNKGKFFIKFNDGTEYKIKGPCFGIEGVMMGKRYVQLTDYLIVEDLRNEMMCVLNFNKEEVGLIGKMFGSGPKRFPDAISGFITEKKNIVLDDKKRIYRPINEELVMFKFDGEWSNYLNCNGNQVWRQGEYDEELPSMEKMPFTLPSDSRYRTDLLLLRHEQEEYAQQAKVHMEEIQRNDAKLREAFKKKINTK